MTNTLRLSTVCASSSGYATRFAGLTSSASSGCETGTQTLTFSASSSCETGRPTMLDRPRTTARLPAMGMLYRLSSVMQPWHTEEVGYDTTPNGRTEAGTLREHAGQESDPVG